MTDVAIVGGGLAGGAIAWLLRERRPELGIRLTEREARLAADRTWSFHESDVGPRELESIRPWITRRWEGYEVAFPSGSRVFGSGYASVRSETFDRAVRERLGALLETGAAGSLQDVRARCVIDARGGFASTRQGYQKFLGLDVELEEPHGLTLPLLMDATVEQLDGFRFIYVLPWGERSLLIEDTRYSDSARIDETSFEGGIREYAARRGWRIRAIERRERAALPIPLDDAAPAPDGPEAAVVGTGAGFFHATTGYSVPDALRVAARVTALPALTTAAVRAELHAYARERASRQAFYRQLNRMLFDAAVPGERFRVLQRFYQLPDPLIRRFYAGQTTWADRMRILVGRPPVPVTRAIRALMFPRPGKEVQ